MLRCTNALYPYPCVRAQRVEVRVIQVHSFELETEDIEQVTIQPCFDLIFGASFRFSFVPQASLLPGSIGFHTPNINEAKKQGYLRTFVISWGRRLLGNVMRHALAPCHLHPAWPATTEWPQD